MPLAPGTRLGVYEIADLIGRGGMGDVYRAHDTRLRRQVAIKVLPDRRERDRDAIARFEREARTLATLNHPNIAVVHGLEDVTPSAGLPPGMALVMELVEGETLADRLSRGPVRLEEAFRIAGQMADALEAAHQKGIVHRDLKPANVMLTPGGLVKVLDFGLAKILDQTVSDATTTATLEATILGTPAYMSPEQARGGPVDRQADVWAFGVVLFEMVTGRRPFGGRSVQETLSAVLTAEPEWARVPPPAEPLVRACLERDPARRLRDIGDYRFLLSDAARPAPRDSPSRRVPRLAAAALALALALAGFGLGNAWSWLGREETGATPTPIRLTTTLPAGVNVTRGPGLASSVAVSPNGRTLVMATTGSDGQRRLYARDLGQLDATPLPGTERAWSPFFSWDGEWLGFFADGQLKRIPAAGGAAVDIVAIPGFPSGASWGPDNRIVFAYGAESPLYTVDAGGGKAEPLEASPASARHPEILPDGRTVLFESGGWVHALDRVDGRSVQLVQGTAPRYAYGHVILIRGTTLLAAPLDQARLELTGPVVPLVENVAVELPGSAGGRHYAISRNGTLVYVPGADQYALVLVHPDGTEQVVADRRRMFENPRFSPNGRLVVVATTEREGQPADLWLHDVQAGTATRLTFDGGRAPVWTPDGTAIAYSRLGEPRGIYLKRADGSSDATLLVALSAFHWLVGWTPDERTLTYGIMNAAASSSLVSSVDGDVRQVVGPGNTWGGRLSPDGRWLAYYVLDSGRFEVLVTPFPDAGARHLIAEGTDPAWAPDGSEVFYRSGARLMAARIDTSAGVRVVSDRVVVEPFLPPLYDDYDVHPDGTLVLVRPANALLGREVRIVVNWTSELQRSVPTR